MKKTLLTLTVLLASSLSLAAVSEFGCLSAAGYYGNIAGRVSSHGVSIAAAQGYAYEISQRMGYTFYQLGISMPAGSCKETKNVIKCKSAKAQVIGKSYDSQDVVLTSDVLLSIKRTKTNSHVVSLSIDQNKKLIDFGGMEGMGSLGNCNFKK